MPHCAENRFHCTIYIPIYYLFLQRRLLGWIAVVWEIDDFLLHNVVSGWSSQQEVKKCALIRGGLRSGNQYITWVRSEMIGLCYGEESCRSVSHLHLSRRRHENITVFLLYTLLLLPPPRHLNAIKLILPRDTIRSLWSGGQKNEKKIKITTTRFADLTLNRQSLCSQCWSLGAVEVRHSTRRRMRNRSVCLWTIIKRTQLR